MKRLWDWEENAPHGASVGGGVFVLTKTKLSTAQVARPEKDRFWPITPATTPGYQPFWGDTCCKNQDSSRINQRKVWVPAPAQAGGSTEIPARRTLEEDMHLLCEIVVYM